jgi:2-dehydro-3-deoxygluconokinase
MKKIVTFGEIMMRLSPPANRRFSQAQSFEVIYGGGESNVAVSLANFKLPVEFVSRIPENDLGDCAIMELRKRNVGTGLIIRGGARLGIYFMEMGAINRSSKVIYDRVFSAMASIQPGMIDWEKVFADAAWFHTTGITPAISQSAADTCLEAIQTANDMGLTVSMDLNYRKNLWKYGKSSSEVMPDLVAGCDIILGNEEDAQMHFGLHPKNVDVSNESSVEGEAYLDVMIQMMKKFPRAKKIITTLRGSISASYNTWAGVLFDGDKMYMSQQYDITHIVDRVGGGDSFMGGLIYGLLTFPEDDQKALDFAVAASALKHTVFGDANLVSVEEVEKVMSGDLSGRVNR